MTTPRTDLGKVVLIFYGFFGCSGGILFFNLFLERIITFLAYTLRAVHKRRTRNMHDPHRTDKTSIASDDLHSDLDTWKPSVYWVMLILFCSAVAVACLASSLYSPVEEWRYFEAIYFCFVAFATIGFGDLVVSQRHEEHYDSYVHLYRLANFLFLVAGCCCIYSLFNVTSIVIKQALNYVIQKLDFNCERPTRPSLPAQRARRNALTLQNVHKTRSGTRAGARPGARGNRQRAPDLVVDDSDSNYDSDATSAQGSSEMISMNDFLQSNHIALAMMQKQLWETAQRGLRQAKQGENAFQDGVGPLAILNKKLGQEES